MPMHHHSFSFQWVSQEYGAPNGQLALQCPTRLHASSSPHDQPCTAEAVLSRLCIMEQKLAKAPTSHAKIFAKIQRLEVEDYILKELSPGSRPVVKVHTTTHGQPQRKGQSCR